MECAPRLAGRQFLCPSCRHPIVIPTPRGDLVGKELQAAHTWDEIVPLPDIEVAMCHRRRPPDAARRPGREGIAGCTHLGRNRAIAGHRSSHTLSAALSGKWGVGTRRLD